MEETQDVQKEEETSTLDTKGLSGPTSFQELDSAVAAQETRAAVATQTDQFLYLTANVMQDGEIEDKGAAVVSLAGEFAHRVQSNSKETWLIDNLKAKWSSSFVSSLPDSSFLYVEPGGKKKDGKTTPKSLRHLPYKDASGKVDLPHLRNAISRLSQSGTGKVGGESWLSESLRAKLLAKARRILKTQSKQAGVWHYVKALFGFDDDKPSSFSIWKEGDSTYWLAIYSNNFRDNDHPPEILSAASHKEFVNAVDAGDWPHPELWLWHVKGTRW